MSPPTTRSVSNDVLDMGLLQRTAEPAREILEVEKINVVADKGYFRTEDIVSCEEAGLTPYVPRAAAVGQKKDSFSKERRRMIKYSRLKLCELGAIVPLVIWLGLGIVGSSLKILQMFVSGEDEIALFPQITTILFLSLTILLLIIRLPPVRNAKGFLPKVAGTVGCLLPVCFLMLPRVTPTPWIAIFSSAVVFLGMLASIVSLYWLGRSFSILPQARSLVMDGPYRYVRHPLYLAELCIVVGRICELEHPWPLIAMLAATASQFWRMHYEEQVLMEAFPSYHEYASRTARLIPGLY